MLLVIPAVSGLFGNYRLLHIHISNVGTIAIQRAFVALWPLSMADSSTMPDEVDVEGVDPFRRGHFVEEVMRLVGVDSGAD